MAAFLTKVERLRGEKRIASLFSAGRRGSVGPIRFCWTSRPAEGSVLPSVLFSVPKKVFKRAWVRNVLKRRLRESYRTRKGTLVETAAACGVAVDIALICSPEVPKPAEKASKNSPRPRPEIPDFKTLDDAVERILEQIVARL